ncbi:MAG: outer membrane protein assembly factor BamA [Pseudomonadales bacterium]|nr:outer membrane protein assembly factor BamA [Pseudomonadales bacterium]MCP5214224.1 outer membrane protein assembly factor BamA [Pseudomonadales bacterium]MCP5302582.1 outer membrane protein assembly factor BamA [Pseudomonadales bacterium]
MNRLRTIPLCLLLALTLLGQQAFAEQFKVADIRIEGLQRVSAGTLFRAFPISLGDVVDEDALVEATRSLFKTGFFNDIQIGRDGDVLVVTVVERPSISSIEIDGNKAIKTEDLKDGLRQAGLDEGEIFQRATLEGLEQELTRQYISQGRYGVEIETDVENQPRNRVALSINITEGAPSSIKQINIVGNSVYDNDELLDLFELRTTHWLSFYKNDDKYSKEKLSGDLERLKSKYLDNGYINFNIESTQVSITPDKSNVYITVNIVEGEKFTIGEVDFAGDLVLDEEELNKYVLVKSGNIFSNELLTATTEALTNRLGNEGYTFANVNGIPQPKEDGIVDVSIFIDPGKRAYVRRVNFRGNTKTVDEVLRREMRQMESGWASNRQIELSKLRLERLGFFKEVNVETPKVAGTEDQIDVDYSVEEQPSGSVTASLGFAQGRGLILGAGVSQNNFLGTGKRVSIGLNRSRFQTAYNFSYLDPYYTVDGVTRGFNMFYRELDYDEDNIASFTTDSYGGGVSFGYPISETQSISFNFGYEATDITEGVFPALEISEFLSEEGENYNEFLFTASWRQSRLNRGVFATRGSSQGLSLELAVPGSDLTYYKLTYKGQIFFPLTRSLTLRLRSDLGYGDSYGDTNTLPFYKHFFAGGFDSIRGFKNNELGPRSTPNPINPDRDQDPFGGNLLVTGGLDIIFPLPFLKDQRSVQSSIFVDAGNVFNTECPSVSTSCLDFDVSEIRYSVGLGATWLSGFGPLTFSIAQAFNEGPLDDTEFFQFSFGKTF